MDQGESEVSGVLGADAVAGAGYEEAGAVGSNGSDAQH